VVQIGESYYPAAPIWHAPYGASLLVRVRCELIVKSRNSHSEPGRTGRARRALGQQPQRIDRDDSGIAGARGTVRAPRDRRPVIEPHLIAIVRPRTMRRGSSTGPSAISLMIPSISPMSPMSRGRGRTSARRDYETTLRAEETDPSCSKRARRAGGRSRPEIRDRRRSDRRSSSAEATAPSVASPSPELGRGGPRFGPESPDGTDGRAHAVGRKRLAGLLADSAHNQAGFSASEATVGATRCSARCRPTQVIPTRAMISATSLRIAARGEEQTLD